MDGGDDPSASAADTDTAANLIAELQAGGEAVEGGEGGFRLDVARAREMLREHQLAEPERYVCLIVEISVLVGAKLIKFTSAGDELLAQFWGAGFERRELEHLADALFVDLGGDEVDEGERRRRRALRLLALVVTAALGAGACELELRSGPAQGRLLITRGDAGESWSFEALDDNPEGGGTQLVVRFPARQGCAGLELLRARCRLSRHPIYVDDQRVSAGAEAGFVIEGGACPATDPIPVVDDDGEAIGAATILTSSEDGRAWIELLTNGWLVERVPLPEGVSGLLAIVEVDLRRDLGQAKVVRDQHFEALLDAVRRSQLILRERAPPAALVEASARQPSLLGNFRGAVISAVLLAGAAVLSLYLYSSLPVLSAMLFVGLLITVIRYYRGGRVGRVDHMLERWWFD